MVGVDVERGPRRGAPGRRTAAAPTPAGASGRRGRAEQAAAGSRPRRAAARPARPAVRASSARRSSWSSSTPIAIGRTTGRRRRQRLHPPDLPRACGTLVAAAGRPGRRRRRRRLGDQAARRAPPTRPCRRRSARSASSRCSTAKEPDAAYVAQHVFRLLSSPRCAGSPTSSRGCSAPTRSSTPADYNRMFGELAALEQHRRTLRDRIGRARSEACGVAAPAVEVGAGGAAAGLGRRPTTAPSSPAPATRSTSPGEPRGCPWEQVEAADWDRDTAALRVSEVGTWGEPRAEHALRARRARPAAGAGPRAGHGQRRAAAARARPRAGAGVRVIARRAPARRPARSTWFFEYDEGVDPDDPPSRGRRRGARRGPRASVGPSLTRSRFRPAPTPC